MRKSLGALYLALAAISCAAFVRCANQVAPQGGPKDSLPPTIRRATPAIGGRHFTDRRIYIEFDEYIQLKDQNKEFFTSPLMRSKPKLSIKGRGVRIEIQDTLVPNQTYALDFGASLRDNNEGNILHGLRYVFSTGPAIDSMLMTGYTADAMKGDSVSRSFVYFYDAVLDSLNHPLVRDSLGNVVGPRDTLDAASQYDSLLFLAKPSAVARAGGNGIFIAQNLKDIPYQIYALEDKNGNQTYEPGVDRVGFLDTLHNPAQMEPVALWLDAYRHYPSADPQIYFRMFTEKLPARYTLSSSERPGRHQAILRFSAAFPQIDTLAFEGIPAERVIRENLTAGRDTIALWFDVAPEMLPDTLQGHLSYMRTDSIGNLVPFSQALKLPWRFVESREQQREREKEEKAQKKAEEAGETYIAPKKPSNLRFKVDAGSEVNPQKSIPIQFEIPLRRLDSTRISLVSVPELGDPVAVPFRVVRDTMNIRLWTIAADWNEESAYRLTIPEGVFESIAGDRNDSLGANFKIMPRAKSATLVVNVTGKRPEAKYILQVLGANGKVDRELSGVTTGVYTIPYLPQGEVRLRITEDDNGNGRWDTGVLARRVQPERVEFYIGPTGDPVIPLRTGWEVDVAADMAQIFAPISIAKIRSDLQRAEDIRVAKYLEAKAKRDAEKKKRESESENAGGLGIGSALGGAKQQMQSAINQF